MKIGQTVSHRRVSDVDHADARRIHDVDHATARRASDVSATVVRGRGGQRRVYDKSIRDSGPYENVVVATEVNNKQVRYTYKETTSKGLKMRTAMLRVECEGVGKRKE